MKLVTFQPRTESSAQPRIGALLDDGQHIVDLAAAWHAQQRSSSPHFTDMLALLDAGSEAMDHARKLLAWAETERPADALHAADAVRLLAPLPRPRSIRDCMSFERHVAHCIRAVARHKAPPLAAADRWCERVMGRGFLWPPKTWHRQPTYYKGNPHSVVGPEAEIRWPRYTRRLDYELEFGIVIGRGGCNLTAREARSHIAGAMIFNDFSARDIQGREMAFRLGPAKGKDFDTGNALGPWLVTLDELPDLQHLAMAARINGEQWSTGNSRDMRWSFDELLAYISQDETLHPGEFIGSGCVPDGCGLELDRWLRPGDVVELEVERLGTLRNRIATTEPGT